MKCARSLAISHKSYYNAKGHNIFFHLHFMWMSYLNDFDCRWHEQELRKSKSFVIVCSVCSLLLWRKFLSCLLNILYSVLYFCVKHYFTLCRYSMSWKCCKQWLKIVSLWYMLHIALNSKHQEAKRIIVKFFKVVIGSSMFSKSYHM